jgi:hypothetical protein
MRFCFTLILISFGCRAASTGKSGRIDTAQTVITDTGPSQVLPEDTAVTEPEPEPETWTGPTGAWSNCTGTLTINEDIFTWQGLSGECSVGGSTDHTDGVLTLNAVDFSSCPDPPWWLRIFEGSPARFAPAVAGTRLTLVPFSPLEYGSVAQFEEHLEHESWVLTTPEGYINDIFLCSVEGRFFGGMYRGVDDSCEFLSCAGDIRTQTFSEEYETWTTTCMGECPCGGVVTVESRTETTMSGSYHGYNCVRVFEGTFTGVPKAP